MTPRSLRIADAWSRQLKVPFAWSLALVVITGLGVRPTLNDFDTFRAMPPRDLARLAAHLVPGDEARREWLM